ncbi:protein VCF1 isoform X1 [Brachyistius frenatus]|uniref:protein VCF1 isoform X1 n=1 Tax=Brachyistius frenatus TaxID=100188 RepID=UPI0037E8EEF8
MGGGGADIAGLVRRKRRDFFVLNFAFCARSQLMKSIGKDGKRQRSGGGGDEETGHLVPQAKRQSRGHPLSPEPGRDAWDSESSNSESNSSISSPEHAAGSCSSQCAVGPCSPLSSGNSSELAGPTKLVSYLQINRILKEAHFQSLHSRGQVRDT